MIFEFFQSQPAAKMKFCYAAYVIQPSLLESINSRTEARNNSAHELGPKSSVVSMLVQEVPKASTTTSKKVTKGYVNYGHTNLDSSAQQTRLLRHLIELEQDNYHAIQIDIPKQESIPLIHP
jgi:hypothetical protein